MNFLCPACRTPLPIKTPEVVACAHCGVEVDLTRVDTAPGQARLWPEVDLVGEQLGDYALRSRAGSGGMGTVYVAQGPTGPCAVKVLSPQLAADPMLRERFRREAQALHAVQHANVVRIFDEGQDRGFCWYAMEYVEGADLRTRLAKGPLTVPEVERLARELLGALEAVHAAQLVHRDLKPGNILLSPEGARLCDFGIARVDGATTLTESAALLGSLKYMAPEQRSGQSSPRADLYSLGVLLHEALGGGLPGEGALPSMPRRLARLLDALLQPLPSRRPVDATAALRLLEPASRRGLLVAAGAVGLGAVLALVAGLLIDSPGASRAASTPVQVPDVRVSPEVDAGAALHLALDDVDFTGQRFPPWLPADPRLSLLRPAEVEAPPPPAPPPKSPTKVFSVKRKPTPLVAPPELSEAERARLSEELDALNAKRPASKLDIVRKRTLERLLNRK